MKRISWVAIAIAAGMTLPGADDAPKSGVDPSYFDAKVRPQDDLFRHVNGKWLAEAKIPSDRPFDGAFIKLRDQSEAEIREIVEAAASVKVADPSSEIRKVGDLFGSFMDEEKVEKLGFDPIRDDLKKIEAISDKSEFLRDLARLQRSGLSGPAALFISTDAKQSDRYIVYMNQSGLGLPDESYYRDEKFQKVRDAYVAHIEKMFKLIGAKDPKADAATVMAVETRLAKGHWDRVRSRDATKSYNKFTASELETLAPNVDWKIWFEGLGAKPPAEVIVRQPSYFTSLSEALGEIPLGDWKTWLTWNVVREAAPLLSKNFVDENFDFYGRTLTGVPEQRPRWKRAVGAVETSMGEAVGKLYVEKHFPAEAKAKMKALVSNLIEAYRVDIQALDWMSAETKSKALDKLSKFTPKIGYPDKWRDYSALQISRDDLVGNLRRTAEFELAYELNKLGKPVDRDEWGMTPQTVNAYYNPGLNEIVFPAAILRPPFFHMTAADGVNYGGIGAVIGHEIGHGFDDQGSKYDGDGNLKDWWTEADRKEFDARSRKLIEQYNEFEPAQLPGQHVNGALTIGENIGDLGGLTIAYKAYELSLKGKEAAKIDGLTGPQRLFIGWAQVWRAKYRDPEMMRRLATDPHSPTEFRCNGVLRNLTEFYDAFNVKEGDKLWLPPEQRVRIW